MSAYWAKIRQVWQAPGNKARKSEALFWLFFWFLYKRLGERGVIIRIFNDLRFRCHPDSVIAEHVLYLSEYVEYDEMHFLQEYLRPGDHFLDVGANVGLHTLLAASVLGKNTGRIIAVEPHPANLALLRENIALNELENVTVLSVAAGDRDAELPLTGVDVFSAIGEAHALADSHAINVPVRRLDSLLPSQSYVAVKIDIEGYEWHALRGLEHRLQAGTLPVIIFELIGHMSRAGEDENAFCDWLQELGYTLGKYDHSLRTLTVSDLPRGDVIAFHKVNGEALIKERISGIKILY